MYPFMIGSRNKWHGVIQGDALELCRYLPDESIDTIVTDPPYLTKYLYLYEWLGTEAFRLLRPGGFLVAMAGDNKLDKVMAHLSNRLKFYYLFQVYMSGNYTGKMHPNGAPMPVITRHKHMAVLHKPGPGRVSMETVSYNPVNMGKNDKTQHVWGQDVDTFRYFVELVTAPGELVLDPFCGGGTTAVAARAVNRRWLMMDNDPVSVNVSRNRLMALDIPPLFRDLPKQQRLELMT